MSRFIFLDSGPLGMVTNPKATPLTLECKLWLNSLLEKGETVILPEIADYEVRRELLRAGKVAGIRQLDRLKNSLMYVPIDTKSGLYTPFLGNPQPCRDVPPERLYERGLYERIWYETPAILLAAQLWAEARRAERPTANPNALDGDVILADQAKLLADRGNEVVVATTNVGHLSQFIDAREWRLIQY